MNDIKFDHECPLCSKPLKLLKAWDLPVLVICEAWGDTCGYSEDVPESLRLAAKGAPRLEGM